MPRIIHNKAFTLVETMVAVAFTLVLVTVVVNFYNTTRRVYSSGISAQMLQDGCHLVLSKLIEGTKEPTGIYRLSEGVSYNIAIMAELHYWGLDNIERWYQLDNTSTQLIYHHPTALGTMDEVIYTAPTGSTLTLRFWIPSVANYSSAVIGVDVALTQTVLGRAVSGAATTLINLRNHP
ncbi:MAG: hypothetical protein HQL15_08750 [Candidatus Omnitrophica bacterium]|nr:hypothetical protein [Candidatus Omnitrophota bacterium]